MNAPFALTVNGRAVERMVDPRTHLGDFLREELNLTGTHLGCEHGVCGACTVIVDGEPARSCIGFAACMHGADVVTIEGLDEDEIAAELRAAFNREHALQCGFCTPGFLIAARDLVLRLPEADERRVRLGLSGNLCRCTGYVGIVRAIMQVIAARRARGIAPVLRETGLGPVGAHAPVEDAGPHSPSSSLARQSGTGSTAALDPRIKPGDEAQQGGTAGALATDFVPAHSFAQAFTVAFPPQKVFAFFANVPEVAACLPGAFVSTMPAPDRAEGGMRVKLGPIAATFRGTAEISRNEMAMAGRIRGGGADGRSSAQGEIAYRVFENTEPGTSRIEIEVGYALKGPLAQFGRPGIVRDIAGRLVDDFANNLEARLAGKQAEPAGTSGLNPLRLLARLIATRLEALFNRVRHGGASNNDN